MQLAPECFETEVFIKESDVWAFGIFMWELFSLIKDACDESVNMNQKLDLDSLRSRLAQGKTLDKPEYATDEM